ncbi:hypothetical protein BDZ89DRAFT_1079157 [Hymenopellis radicata]|nr:hypothetical protein BDZ89DRAFT_1079157 [Hymenopellis radicata]
MAREEKEIQAILRRAEKSPQGSNARRTALETLIELAHTEDASLRILAVHHIKHYFSEFSDIEEDAINAVYDVCEDSVGRVRIEGYKAITGLSQGGRWVKRNTDVLLQLLQSDEAAEVTVIEQALIDHLDMDAECVLGVLYDAEDERELVDRFFTNAKVREAMEDEKYADAYLKVRQGTPRITDEAEFDRIIREHVLPLSVSKTRGDQLLDLVLSRTPPSQRLAHDIVVTYIKLTPRVKPEERAELICKLADVLALCDTETAAVQAISTIPVLFGTVSQEAETIKAYRTWLAMCLQRQKQGSTIPKNVLRTIQNLSVIEDPEIQEAVLALKPPPDKPAPTIPPPKHHQLPARPQSQPEASTSSPIVRIKRTQTAVSESAPRKKAKLEEENSLVRRMSVPVGANNGKDAPPVEDLRMRELSIKGGLETKGRARGRRSAADVVSQEFSIKGGAAVASAKKETPPVSRVATPKSASLLDRIGR